MRAKSVKLPPKGALLELSQYDDDVLIATARYVILEVLRTKHASFVEDAKLIDMVVLSSTGVVRQITLHECELRGERWYGSRKVVIRTQ